MPTIFFSLRARIFLPLLLFLLAPAALGAPTFRYERTYKIGEKFGYKFSTKRTNPGQPNMTADGQTAHEVKEVMLAPGEMVKWVSLVEYNHRGLIDHSTAAKSAEPFLLGLPPLGRRGYMEKLPPEISGFSQDLSNVYQMIDTSVLGVRVLKAGDKYTFPVPLLRGFSGNNGADTMASCFERSIELVSWDAKRAKIRVRDAAPKSCPGLRLPAPLMASQINGVPVNFGNIRRSADGRTDLNWGTESTEYDIDIDAVTGIILRAKREDKTLRIMRFNCDAQFKNCQTPGQPVAAAGASAPPPAVDKPMEEVRTLSMDLVR